MNTVEAAYIFAITILSTALIISAAIRLHEDITGSYINDFKTEYSYHQKDMEKNFKVEKFIRALTLLEDYNESNDQ